jgi:hypothetical protein
MRNARGLGKVTTHGILPLFILSFFTIGSLTSAAADLNRNIAALKKEITEAQGKLSKAKPGDNFDKITMTLSIQNMRKLVTSLSQEVKNVPSMATQVNKLNGAIKSLEVAKKRNDKAGAQKTLKDMAATLRGLETEVARRGREKRPPQAAAPGTPSSKKENFLKEIERARSLEELDRVLKSSNFSQAELKELEQQVKRPPYSNKLQRLIDQKKSSSKARMEAKVRPMINQKEREFQQRQEQELRQLNNQAVGKLQGLKARQSTTARVPSRKSVAISTSGTHQMSPLGKTTPGEFHSIHSVSPEAATVGERLTISGEGFGASPGTVAIVIGREVVYCPVSSWEQRRIVVTVSEDVQDIVGETEKEGFVRVMLSGGQLGPYWNLTIRPDPSRITPEITSLSTAEIRPGQTLIIEGRNFLTERRGTVTFAFSGFTLRGGINDWDDTFISVTLPEGVSRLTRTDGTVTVTNYVGLQVNKSITFVPTLHTVTLESHRDAYAFIIGYKGSSVDFDFELHNDWKVAENWLWCAGGPLTYGCEFVAQAAPGSTNAYSSTLIWCDLLAFVECINYLRIEGPVGVRYGE